MWRGLLWLKDIRFNIVGLRVKDTLTQPTRWHQWSRVALGYPVGRH